MNVVCAYDLLLRILPMRSCQATKTRLFEGVPNARAGVDVIFIDCLENLPVPGLSKPPHVVPT